MDFLLSHWHCILPAAGIIAALFLMRNKSKDPQDSGCEQRRGRSDLYEEE